MINILFCIDLSYWQYVGITLSSLLRANPRDQFQVFIIATANPSPDEAEKLAAVTRATGNATLEVIPVKNTPALQELPLNEHLSVAAYYRLFMLEYLPATIDRVLYLDGDLLIRSTLIRQLWETSLGNNYLGAVMEPYSARTREPIGFGPDDFYFNSGVMLINLHQWRTDAVTPKLLAFAAANSTRLPGHDQDVLNCVFRGRVVNLGLRWNWQAVFPRWLPQELGLSKEEFEHCKRSPEIIHFTGYLKPWFWRYHPHYKDLYLQVKRRTPWAAIKPSDIGPKHLPIKLRRHAQQILEWNFPALAGSYLRSRTKS